MLAYMAKGTLEMWLRIQTWGNYPGLGGWAPYITMILKRRVQEGSSRERARDTGNRKRSESAAWLTFKTEEGAMSRARRQPPDTGKGKETDSPSALPEWMQLCWNLSHLRLISDFDLQNCKTINLCCFKSPNCYKFARYSSNSELIHMDYAKKS